MTDKPPEAARVAQKLHPLSAQLYKAIEYGVDEALKFFEPEGYPSDAHLFAFLVRYHALRELPEDAERIDGELSICGKALCGIELRRPPWVIKVWKKPNGEGSWLQPPGESASRQRFYNQQPPVPGTEHLFSENLVYVWDTREGGGVDVWLAKPFGLEDNWKGEALWVKRIDHPAEFVVPSPDFAVDDEPLEDLERDAESEEDPQDGA